MAALRTAKRANCRALFAKRRDGHERVQKAQKHATIGRKPALPVSPPARVIFRAFLWRWFCLEAGVEEKVLSTNRRLEFVMAAAVDRITYLCLKRPAMVGRPRATMDRSDGSEHRNHRPDLLALQTSCWACEDFANAGGVIFCSTAGRW